MPRPSAAFDISRLHIEVDPTIPRQQAVYLSLRKAILSAKLKPCMRLPSTRLLSAELGIARNTVLAAYQRLSDEGYLDASVGSGSFVSARLPEDWLHAPTAARASTQSPTRPVLSRMHTQMLQLPAGGRGQNEAPVFRTGVPALDLFPTLIWSRLVARAWRSATPDQLDYGHSAGLPHTRMAIAAYLGAARGVRCEADQVFVCAGSQGALTLICNVLVNEGDAVWMEDPGYYGARHAFSMARARTIPLPIDAEGLQVAAGERLAPDAQMAYITPSYQYPLGVTMSLERRLALLQWAQQKRAWILEDDYSSEFRFAGRPLAAVQGLDPHGRVLYVGTFSKVMFPGLRIGYVVVPPALVAAFHDAMLGARHFGQLVDQAALAAFIDEGHFARHIRRMRSVYAERRDALEHALTKQLPDLLEVRSAPAGIHLTAHLRHGRADVGMAAAAARHGLFVQALSGYSAKYVQHGLVLGYGNNTPAVLRKSVLTLRDAIA